MTPERWAQIRQIFDVAVEHSPKERKIFLRAACAGDEKLRGEVESLLESHDESADFLQEPVVEVGRALTSVSEDSGEYPQGYRVGPYQLDRCIGHGGMGSVWMASRTDHEYLKKVAIKLVRRGMDSKEILRRFRLERQVLAGLDHINIARLIDGGSTPDGLPYLVMEYVEGTPIDQYCESRKITITDRLKLFCAVCAAVQFAHQNLVVHRDIKTGNIVVTADGVPKLLDFGIAKLLRSDDSALDLAQTRPEMRPMTLDYASPEQVRGDLITTATDVYSLGVLLYKLLTGKMPYGIDSRSPGAVRKAICELEPRRPSSVILTDSKGAIPDATQKLETVQETRDKARRRLKKKLAGDLDMIILKALRKEPQLRYASVEQFAQDIRRYLEGRPVIARGGAFGYRAGKFVQRNVTGIVAAVAVSLALIAGSSFYEHRATIQQARNDRDFQETRQELLTAYLRQGEIEETLADGHASAVESYRKALQIAQDIGRAHPEQTITRRDAGRAALKLADLLSADGNRTDSVRLYTESLTQFEAAAALDSSNPSVQRDIMNAVNKLGFSQFEQGNLLAALASHSRALQIAERLYATETAGGRQASKETTIAVASSSYGAGNVLVHNNAIEEGLVKLRKARDTYQRLYAAIPTDADVRNALIKAHQAMGYALSAAGRTREAVNSYQSALALVPADTELTLQKELREKVLSLSAGAGGNPDK